MAHYSYGTESGSVAAVLAAVTDDGTEQTITTGFTNPDFARNVTATAGGTSGDIKAIQVVVAGTDVSGAAITETLPAFTENTTGTVTGSKAFKTITSVTIPAHDGTGATTSIGTGNKIGLSHMLSKNTVLYAFLDNVKETTAPTVTVNPSILANNTVSLDSGLNGDVDIYYLVSGGE